jgi:hypothetical protein
LKNTQKEGKKKKKREMFSIFRNFGCFIACMEYPLELLPPQSDFQGKKFLRKNFHPFSGPDGGSWQQTVEVGNIFIGA